MTITESAALQIAQEKVIEKRIISDTVEREIPQPPTDLIFDDGIPMESTNHRRNMNVLIRSVVTLMESRNRKDYFVGGNMFIYYSTQQVKNKDYRDPDFLLCLNVDGEKKDRLGWVVWEEGGRYPDVIIELMSPSTAKVDQVTKKELYEQTFRTPNYFIYDPVNADFFKGWDLSGGKGYQELEVNEKGWLWCRSLDVWVGRWEGIIDDQKGTWLRFYHQDGSLVLLPEEMAKQLAETEKQRADAEKQRADVEKQRADVEKQRAEAEKQRAEAEKQRAEAEKQRADRLAERLRELGEDIE